MTTDENNQHEGNSQQGDGFDPETTAADLRRILAASGGGADILAQHDALRQWAREQGRSLDAATVLAPTRLGGLEHRIAPDEAGDRIIKVTYGGCFGRIARITRDGLALRPASPLDYLDRWARHNALFDPLTSILGIIEGRGGPQIVIAQRTLRGPAPAPDVLGNWLRKAGYSPVEGMLHVWRSLEKGVVLFDARPANFVQIEDESVPFDVIPMPLEDVGL